MKVRSFRSHSLLDDMLMPEIDISHFTIVDAADPVNLPHRDGDYVFLFQRTGYLSLMVDDQPVELKDRSVFFILPGQLRYHVASTTDTWVLAVNGSFLQETLRLKLNEHYYGNKAVSISKKKAERFSQCISFLAEELSDPNYKLCKMTVRKGLIDVISGMITEEYAAATSMRQGEHSRFSEITREFKELLLNNFKKMRKPGDYADALSLSVPYLNQVIKSSTGFTVSHWIQKMIMNEARVLLSATLKPVKDIAHELGYLDQAYFSRMFSKIQGVSPQQYRLSKQKPLPGTTL
ncbi:AraC-like DNA-binding protein [Mucilaginibacter rubeus]|uniref:AraC family transcriptional regulator n=1 Tax=Mucilaginibacter rubeus TaxID=2027860 RepID=UPI00339A6122